MNFCTDCSGFCSMTVWIKCPIVGKFGSLQIVDEVGCLRFYLILPLCFVLFYVYFSALRESECDKERGLVREGYLMRKKIKI